jgi:4a-hydroxytetrahydrobiopterin dehydratase
MNSSTADTLINKKCVPCHGGVSAIAPAEAQRMVERLLWVSKDGVSKDGSSADGWQLVEGGKALKREFKFPDFYRAMSFVNAVAHIANAEDHHPDIECGWGYCRIRYQTHSIGGLHENDFICAAKVDAIPR